MTSGANDHSSLLSAVTRWGAARNRRQIQLFCLLSVLAVGCVDYVVGNEISLAVIYAVPISIGTWLVGLETGLSLVALSVLLWVGGDFANGLYNSGMTSPVINVVFRPAFYGFMVIILRRLSTLQRHIELRSERRATALARETAERQRLKEQLLAISDREQRRIGQDLHDGLCQHLTATALLGHVLVETLEEEGHATAPSARKLIGLVNESISLSKGVAKGLLPVDIQSEGLMQALEEFAATTSGVFGIDCALECPVPVLVHDRSVATHMFRIVQEAVSNAIKHGRARSITITLEETESGFQVTISDNGVGITPPLPQDRGMGLRIMADRTSAVGGRFTIGQSRTGGVALKCEVPNVNSDSRNEPKV